MEKRIENFWNSKTGWINDYVKRLVICEAKKFGVQFDKVDTKYYVLLWGGIFHIELKIVLICENKKIYFEIGEICKDYLHNPTVMACKLEDIMELSSHGYITFARGNSYELSRLDFYKSPYEKMLLVQFSKPDILLTFLTDVPTITKICKTAYTVYSQFYLNYFANLPKAYSFLLSNKTKKQFPRDIAKLIAYKILFASDASHPRCP